MEPIPLQHRRRFQLVAVVALVLAAWALPNSELARADFPTCGGNHSAYALQNCPGATSVRSVLPGCAPTPLRSGPGTDYPVHAGPIAGAWTVYKVVFRSPLYNQGCGGITTNQWNLVSIGWASRSSMNGP